MKKTYVSTMTVLFVASLLLSSCASSQSNRMMTWDDYVRQPRNNPYVLKMNYRDGSLMYYGAFHKVDPSHPQFEDIEQKWENFQPTVAYCEGNIWPLEASRTKAIKNYGEQGLLTWLAARDGIRIECIDPPLADQAMFLKKHFPPHLIKVYYVMRQAAIDRMLKKDISSVSCANRYFRKFNQIEGYNQIPTNLDQYERMVSVLFPGLDEWQTIPYSYFHQRDSGGFLVDIHRKLNGYRDQIMLQKVVQALKKGQRVFAIVGRSHVVIQEAALKSLL